MVVDNLDTIVTLQVAESPELSMKKDEIFSETNLMLDSLVESVEESDRTRQLFTKGIEDVLDTVSDDETKSKISGLLEKEQTAIPNSQLLKNDFFSIIGNIQLDTKVMFESTDNRDVETATGIVERISGLGKSAVQYLEDGADTRKRLIAILGPDNVVSDILKGIDEKRTEEENILKETMRDRYKKTVGVFEDYLKLKSGNQ